MNWELVYTKQAKKDAKKKLDPKKPVTAEVLDALEASVKKDGIAPTVQSDVWVLYEEFRSGKSDKVPV